MRVVGHQSQIDYGGDQVAYCVALLQEAGD